MVSLSLNCEKHPHSNIPSQAVLPILVSDTGLPRGVINVTGHLTPLPTLAKSKCRSTTPFGIGGQGVRSGRNGGIESGLVDSLLPTAVIQRSSGTDTTVDATLDVDRPVRAGQSDATG